MAAIASSSRAAMGGSSRFSRGSLSLPGEEDTIAFFQTDDQLQRARAAASESPSGIDGTDGEAEPQHRVWTGESMYVRIFQEMMDTVLEHEQHLFTSAELEGLQRYRAMTYPSRYLLVRLMLRKRGKWHRLDHLRARYSHEIGDQLSSAVSELCQGYVRPPSALTTSKRRVSSVCVDDELRKALAASLLSFESEVKARQNDFPSIARDPQSAPPDPQHNLKGKELAQDEEPIASFALPSESASLEELLETLTLDELRELAKQMKIRHTQNRKQLLSTLTGHASNQITLSFTKSDSSVPQSGRQSLLPFTSSARSQEDRVRAIVLKKITAALKLDDGICNLFSRLNLIFFRSTTPTPVLLPLILTSSKRRHYPPYETNRTPSIFPSRDLLIEYEHALNLEGRIDALLQGEEGYNLHRLEIARTVKELGLSVYPRWEALVAEIGSESMKQRASLQRFDSGHILSRIVAKLAGAYGQLREHEDEMRVLRALLDQSRWRQGHRGGWYDRLALILMTHCGKKKEAYEEAMKITIAGLEDSKTHLIYRPSLERRLTRLEKKLEIPESERHTCAGFLRKPTINTISGIRIRTPVPSSGESRSRIKRSSSSEKENKVKEEDTTLPKAPLGVKSVWQGREGEVSVELLALEWYEDRGYRGFHAEGRIVSTLFTLLFFDILYMPVPGAFETKYQTAPLDLSYDTFYASRREAIDLRLAQLRAGQGPRIIAEVDDRERPNQTWCVGVRWDMFEKSDLVEIAEGLGGDGLAVICQLLCEEYGQRGGGVPDLIIWNAAEKTTRFVEVKGPGDNLMETQKIWADVLLSAGVVMEVCRVVEEGENTKEPPKKTTKSNTKKRKVEVIILSDSEDDRDERSLSRPLADATATKCNKKTRNSM
ncbi:hypothetical protein CALCODRAFT_452810 [Calocera cornea HHB12733]|uniref:Fanconi-associated nuclease n=1 Tax=Calocera cornea HHB12733 TaxID=1353952 RepID=A0A165G4E5_9BASI|nr:hypothetical protein CALCODRAFT_452810 [Calocera cornea HHB12733]